jgi:signal transduction histidine kinase
MRFLRKQLFLFLFIILHFSALSQDSVINVSSFEDYLEVLPSLSVWRSTKEITNVSLIPIKEFRNYPSQKNLSEKNFFQPRWFQLKLFYSGEEQNKTLYFYPGKMVGVNVYRYDSSRHSWINVRRREGFSAISLSSKISLVPFRLQKDRIEIFLIQPDLHYYNWTQWNPTIAHTTAINDLILHEFIQPNYTYSILTILMAGMMFMLFSYSILKFYLNRRSEYLYNSLFAFTFLLFFAVVFINNFYYHSWWHKYSGFFLYWLQILGYIIEFVFIIRFLELRTKRHKLFLFLRAVIIALMVYCCILPFLTFSDKLYPLNVTVFNIIGISLIGLGLYTALVLYKWSYYLGRYVASGLIALTCFLGLIILQNTILKEKQYLVLKIGGAIILYHAGILANLFFFRLGLGHKERVEELQKLEDIDRLRLENEKKELEKILGIASSRVEERNRIAKEIHDDIGSGLTSIRLLSEIALVKQANKEELKKISANANELVNNLNEIIWSINSKNDTLPNLLAYIRSHMVDYLEPYNIKLSISIPLNVPNIEIEGEKRRNIFMIIKECFTNISKHANATAVNFTVQVRDQLIFTIKDNGKGFDDKDILPFKNGIRNMRERIEHIGGEIDISGKHGTTITVKFPLNGNNQPPVSSIA